MDPSTIGVLQVKTRMFYTTGQHDIIEMEWDKPEPKNNEVEVKNIFTGVCRSDIDMYKGDFTLPSIYMQGHEGLGVITKVGKQLKHLYFEGDIVATRGEPSFADYYNAEKNTFVVIPEADPKYIVEPVACALNIFNTAWGNMIEDSQILIFGTGFLSQVLYKTIRYHHINNPITVVGNANLNFWMEQDCTVYNNFHQIYGFGYDVIFDLSDKPEYMTDNLEHINPEAMLILAAEKHPEMILPMSDLLWKAVSILFPSPRNGAFIHAMETSVDMIETGVIDTSTMWTKAYDRDTGVKQAFEDGLNRPEGYQRGYIQW